jgi:hypothetical protein
MEAAPSRQPMAVFKEEPMLMRKTTITTTTT